VILKKDSKIKKNWYEERIAFYVTNKASSLTIVNLSLTFIAKKNFLGRIFKKFCEKRGLVTFRLRGSTQL